tara:strand:+ start:1317 stop:1835 length:519 start_codon:yes stop_codon:yes gene_type:complete
MNLFFKSILCLFFFVFLTFTSKADQKLKYVNIDLLISKTNLGSQMLKKISDLDKLNIENLKLYEEELKNLENEISLKKNIISDEQFNKELNNLQLKITDYNKNKKLMVKKLKSTKNEELKIFFNKINPIIQNFMSDNSIEMIFNSKNIFMGNKNSDLTDLLIDEINNKLKVN